MMLGHANAAAGRRLYRDEHQEHVVTTLVAWLKPAAIDVPNAAYVSRNFNLQLVSNAYNPHLMKTAAV